MPYAIERDETKRAQLSDAIILHGFKDSATIIHGVKRITLPVKLAGARMFAAQQGVDPAKLDAATEDDLTKIWDRYASRYGSVETSPYALTDTDSGERVERIDVFTSISSRDYEATRVVVFAKSELAAI